MQVTDEPTAEAIIGMLDLAPHPEGGWYAETWRDDASSAIWFLLRRDERSHWHRVQGAAEVWHHYLGDSLRLQLSADGKVAHSVVLGCRLAGGERPQVVVPAGWWQAATPLTGERGFTLVGCTVAPPFRFEAFELAPPEFQPPSARGQ
jgi:predicted cupin superfamily sugar epimerase